MPNRNNNRHEDRPWHERVWRQVSGQPTGGRTFDAQRNQGTGQSWGEDFGRLTGRHIQRTRDARRRIGGRDAREITQDAFGTGRERPAIDIPGFFREVQRGAAEEIEDWEWDEDDYPSPEHPHETRVRMTDREGRTGRDSPGKSPDFRDFVFPTVPEPQREGDEEPRRLGTFQGEPVYEDDPRLEGPTMDMEGAWEGTRGEFLEFMGADPRHHMGYDDIPTVEEMERQQRYERQVREAQEARETTPFDHIPELPEDATTAERARHQQMVERARGEAAAEQAEREGDLAERRLDLQEWEAAAGHELDREQFDFRRDIESARLGQQVREHADRMGLERDQLDQMQEQFEREYQQQRQQTGMNIMAELLGQEQNEIRQAAHDEAISAFFEGRMLSETDLEQDMSDLGNLLTAIDRHFIGQEQGEPGGTRTSPDWGNILGAIAMDWAGFDTERLPTMGQEQPADDKQRFIQQFLRELDEQ